MEINIEELSLEEKIGQMLIIGMDTNYITDRIKNMIQKYWDSQAVSVCII